MTARRVPVIPVDTPEIDISQLAAAVKGGATIVDVREPGEYVAGHVPGAVAVPSSAATPPAPEDSSARFTTPERQA
jgi:rhodanese-related sulfurtransferase